MAARRDETLGRHASMAPCGLTLGCGRVAFIEAIESPGWIDSRAQAERGCTTDSAGL
jgi:hypothetical protein